MSENARRGSYARDERAADPNQHRHGDVVHSHPHTGAYEHGDDLEYDEAHDADAPERPGPERERPERGGERR